VERVANDQDCPPLADSLQPARRWALHVSEALPSHVTIIMQVTCRRSWCDGISGAREAFQGNLEGYRALPSTGSD
jgi:hypothetical protein